MRGGGGGGEGGGGGVRGGGQFFVFFGVKNTKFDTFLDFSDFSTF